MTKREQKQIRLFIGTIYQDFCLVENSTCLDNVLTACLPDMGFFPAVFGIYGKERRAEALKFLDRVGLSEKAEEPVKISPAVRNSAPPSREPYASSKGSLGRRARRVPGPGHRAADPDTFKGDPEKGRRHDSYEQP